MLVRTKAGARVTADAALRRRLFRRTGQVSFGDGFQLPSFGFDAVELDWGSDGIRKTMRVRDGWMYGTFEYDLRGWSLLTLPVYYPLAAVFVRVETRRRARWDGDDWMSHPGPNDGRRWLRYPDIPPDDDDGGAGVREPRRPRPSSDGASAERPLPGG